MIFVRFFLSSFYLWLYRQFNRVKLTNEQNEEKENYGRRTHIRYHNIFLLCSFHRYIGIDYKWNNKASRRNLKKIDIVRVWLGKKYSYLFFRFLLEIQLIRAFSDTWMFHFQYISSFFFICYWIYFRQKQQHISKKDGKISQTYSQWLHGPVAFTIESQRSSNDLQSTFYLCNRRKMLCWWGEKRFFEWQRYLLFTHAFGTMRKGKKIYKWIMIRGWKRVVCYSFEMLIRTNWLEEHALQISYSTIHLNFNNTPQWNELSQAK